MYSFLSSLVLPQPNPPASETSRLPLLPYDVLHLILSELSSPVDRECLRASCRNLYGIIPRQIFRRHRTTFLRRLLSDLPEVDKKGKIVCCLCVSIVEYKLVRRGFGSTVKRCERCGTEYLKDGVDLRRKIAVGQREMYALLSGSLFARPPPVQSAPIALLPYDVLHLILLELRSPVDRECLRATCRNLRNALAPHIPRLRQRDRTAFLRRIFWDYPDRKKRGKIVCYLCGRIVRYKLVWRQWQYMKRCEVCKTEFPRRDVDLPGKIR